MTQRNDTFTVYVDNLANGGDGVARLPDGRACFLPKTIPGETVEMTLLQGKKQWGRGVVKRVLIPSLDRVQPTCTYFNTCGGCQFWHMTYDAEIRLKAQATYETVAKLSGINVPAPTIIPAPTPVAYRNRATFHIRNGVLGFFQERSSQIIAIESCLVVDRVVDAAAKWLQESLHTTFPPTEVSAPTTSTHTKSTTPTHTSSATATHISTHQHTETHPRRNQDRTRERDKRRDGDNSRDHDNSSCDRKSRGGGNKKNRRERGPKRGHERAKRGRGGHDRHRGKDHPSNHDVAALGDLSAGGAAKLNFNIDNNRTHTNTSRSTTSHPTTIRDAEAFIETADANSAHIVIKAKSDADFDKLVKWASNLAFNTLEHVRGVRIQRSIGDFRDFGRPGIDIDCALPNTFDSPLHRLKNDPTTPTPHLPVQRFRQGYSLMNQQLRELVVAWAQELRPRRILELFCGMGNFTFALAPLNATIDAYDVDHEAIALAKTLQNLLENRDDTHDTHAANNNSPSPAIRWHVVDLFAEGFSLFAKKRDRIDLLLLDPPRAGARRVVESLETADFPIIYVACDPASLGRDAKTLGTLGYQITRLAMVDMFPRTSHIETVALFIPR